MDCDAVFAKCTSVQCVQDVARSTEANTELRVGILRSTSCLLWHSIAIFPRDVVPFSLVRQSRVLSQLRRSYSLDMAAMEKQDADGETYLLAAPIKKRFEITQRHVAAWTLVSSVIWLFIFTGHFYEKYWSGTSAPDDRPAHGIAKPFSWNALATKPYLDYVPCLDGYVSQKWQLVDSESRVVTLIRRLAATNTLVWSCRWTTGTARRMRPSA